MILKNNFSNNQIPKKFFFSLEDLIIITFFVFFLHPIYYKGISINYSYLLIPIILAVVRRNLIKPDPIISLFFISCCIVFLFALIFNLDEQFIFRRFTSFVIIMSLISFSFLRINHNIILNFTYAIIISSTILAIPVILDFLSIENFSNILLLKGQLGGQREVVIHLMAFFCLLYILSYEKNTKFVKLVMFLLAITSFLGVMLSFSRSAYTAFAITSFFFLYRLINLRSLIKTKNLIYMVLLSFIFFIFNDFLDLFLSYYQFTFVDKLFSGFLYENFSSNFQSSEGVRFKIWSDVVIHVLNNPILGNGFLGYWAITQDLSGYSHSDYFDRFLRFGIPLFAMYLYIIFQTLVYLKKNFSSFYYGFISLLIFGIFHEAFALSTGAVILSFLISLYSQRKLKKT